jgi:protein-disulfide isomerase
MKIGQFAVFLLLFLLAATVPLTAQTATLNSPLIRTDPAVPSGTLATIDGQFVTLDGLDPAVADAVAHLDETEKNERKRVFELALGMELFTLEGRPHQMSGTDVAALEVQTKSKPPTQAEVLKVYQEHYADFGGAELEKVRPQIVAYLKQNQQDAILTALAQRLRAKYSVTFPTDINAPGLNANSVLALIAGKPMLAGPVMERWKPVIYNVRSQLYTPLRQSLDQAIYTRLILAEAKRRDVEPNVIIRNEITEHEGQVSETDVAQYFKDNATYFSEQKLTLDMARNSIVQYLESNGRARLEADLSARLRKEHTVVDYLVAPEPPVQSISVDDDPARGDVNAPVTVVMFTDFQCPACSKTHPILQEILKPYGNRVRFVVRDYPLPMHPDSEIAAEAANAANAQGKFFEYIEILYKHQDALSIPQLKEYATQIGLNRAKFDLALAQHAYAREIIHDVEDGEKYGISGTPGIFVNGRRVADLQPATLQLAVDQAFAATGVAAPPKP